MRPGGGQRGDRRPLPALPPGPEPRQGRQEHCGEAAPGSDHLPFELKGRRERAALDPLTHTQRQRLADACAVRQRAPPDGRSRVRAPQYYGTIQLGSQNVSLNMCFDTGSADLWCAPPLLPPWNQLHCEARWAPLHAMLRPLSQPNNKQPVSRRVPSQECNVPSCLAHTRYSYEASSTYQVRAWPRARPRSRALSSGARDSESSVLARPGKKRHCHGLFRSQGRDKRLATCVLQQVPPHEPALTAPAGTQPTATRFSIRYGSGAVHGRVALETVALADPPLRLHRQAIGLAVESSADFASASCDGIFVRAGSALPCTPEPSGGIGRRVLRLPGEICGDVVLYGASGSIA